MLSPSGHFMLHWNNTGPDAVPQEDISGSGIPDFIDSAAVIFDRVWHTEVDELGYQAPPGPDGGPTARYHIYFSNLGYYGLTWFDKQLIIDNRIKYTSFMEVDNDFDGFYSPGLEGLKVTAAHEFHHAIQLGYNVRQQDFFFYEMTSTFMEEYNYPGINDYRQYLDEFFDEFSNTPFNYYNQFTFFPYGNFLYVLMLNDLHGVQIIHDIWQEILDRPSLNALQDVLAAPVYGSSWAASLEEYGKWLYYTGDRHVPGNFFADAAEFPMITVSQADTYVFPDQIPQTVFMSSLANYYLRFIGTRGSSLNLLVASAEFSDGGFRLFSGGEGSDFYTLGEPVNLAGITTDTIIVQLVNARNAGREYGLDASTTGTTAITLGPNPVRLADGQRELLFRNIPEDAQIFIFSAAGLEIARIAANPSSTRVWDLTNTHGREVASGVYIYLLKSGSVKQTGKIAVIR